MDSSKNRASVVFFMVISLVLDSIFAQVQLDIIQYSLDSSKFLGEAQKRARIRWEETIDMKCNPSIRHRFDICPDGYCCVRDEFLPTYVYCRKIGLEDENCTTRDTDSECPCAVGLICKPNIASTFQSLYGRCYNATKHATTLPPTTSTTTPMVTSDVFDTTTPTTVPDTTVPGNTTTKTTQENATVVAMSSVMADNSTTTTPKLPIKIPVIG